MMSGNVQEMLDDIHSRWAADGEFGRELKNVDPEMQAKTSQLYQECQGARGAGTTVVLAVPVVVNFMTLADVIDH
jgi:hypothetical protein